jgi:adenylate cyclase class 2
LSADKMAYEIEAKLKYDKHEDLRKVLEEAGADFAGEYIQRDSYYDDAACSLRGRGCAFRLREEVEAGDASVRKMVVTVKGPVEASQFKKRTEDNLEVKDRLAAERMIRSLGYHKSLLLEKRRSVWRLGGCEVAMDELPLIGRFVEIEGPDENAVGAVQARIGLANLEHITKSYTSMVLGEMNRLGINQVEVTFGL